MEKRFESKSEAGGRKEQGKPEAQSWLERFLEKFQKESKPIEDDKTAEKSVSIASFIKGIFKRGESDKENWIDREFEYRESQKTAETDTDDHKLADLNEDERTEFYMVVAQRFKDAGARFIRFVRGDATPKLVIQNDADGVTQISPASAMYRDEYEDDLSSVPELSVPDPSVAPPFDFAIDNRVETKMRERRQAPPSSIIDRAPAKVLPVDDFDYPSPSAESDKRVTNVSRDENVTTINYRPRIRDVLFAAGVGKPGLGVEQRPQTAPASQPEQPSAQASSPSETQHIDSRVDAFKAEQASILNQQDRNKKARAALERREFEAADFEAELDEWARELDQQKQAIEETEVVSTGPTPEVLQTVKQAMNELLKPQEEAQEVSLNAEGPQAEQSVEQFEELEFRNLKPALHEQREASPEPTMPVPDNVHVRVASDKDTASPVEKTSRIENPFVSKLRESQAGGSSSEMSPEKTTSAAATQPASSVSAGYGDAMSVNEILANRTQIPGQPRNSAQAGHEHSYLNTPKSNNNGVVLSVIAILILVALLFVTAV